MQPIKNTRRDVTTNVTIDPNMKSYANDPFFVEKLANAKIALHKINFLEGENHLPRTSKV